MDQTKIMDDSIDTRVALAFYRVEMSTLASHPSNKPTLSSQFSRNQTNEIREEAPDRWQYKSLITNDQLQVGNNSSLIAPSYNRQASNTLIKKSIQSDDHF